VRTHARTLAELHVRLHRIPPPVEAPARYGPPQPGDVLLHGDLHPMNVLLSAAGPVVIDWTNGGRGPGALDVADTWLVLAAAGLKGAPVLAALRGLFLREFLAAAGRDEAARFLRQAAGWRARDPHLADPERDAMLRIAAAERR
jgi:aminoglycoside phosphotransferase (APT) family kinase protein